MMNESDFIKVLSLQLAQAKKVICQDQKNKIKLVNKLREMKGELDILRGTSTNFEVHNESSILDDAYLKPSAELYNTA